MIKDKLIKDIDVAIASEKIDDNTKELLIHYRNELSSTTNKKRYIEIFVSLIRLVGIGYDIFSS